MTRIIAVANQKGGVGKTTTAVNLSASLALSGHRTLLVDLDPQGNATTGCGLDGEGLQRTVGDWLMGEASLGQILAPCVAGFDLAPANRDLTAAEVRLLAVQRREARLRERLQEEAGVQDYAYLLMDCPPALNILTLNALVAAHSVLVPMQCEYYALEGFKALLDTVEGVRRRANPKLAVEGLLRTMYDSRNSLSRDVSRQLVAHFGKKVFRTVVPRNVRLAEAPSHGQPAILYDRHCPGALAYMALAEELAHSSKASACG